MAREEGCRAWPNLRTGGYAEVKVTFGLGAPSTIHALPKDRPPWAAHLDVRFACLHDAWGQERT